MNDKQQKEQNFKFGKKIIKNDKEYESFSYVGWNGKNQPIISIIDCETGKQYTRVIHKNRFVTINNQILDFGN